MSPTPFLASPPSFDLLCAVGIGGLAVVMAGVVVWLRVRYQRLPAWPTAATLTGWMLLTGVLASTGVLARFDRTPPPMAVLIPFIFGLAFAIGLSPLGGRLAQAVPIETLVGLQMFRLPLELLMHRAAGLGIMPTELSYSGYNFDIVTGAGALVLFVALRATHVPRAIVWAWNLWGLGCLAVIAWIARSSSPMVRAFGEDPLHINTWVLYFPYVWLPTVLVVTAVAGHLVLTRALLRRA